MQIDKTAFIAGSSGFIAGHLIKRLQSEGYLVVGADIVYPQYAKPDIFYQYDLRDQHLCFEILHKHKITECYNLACIMGGMGFIGDPAHRYDIMVGSTLINSNILFASIEFGVKNIFYSSSACVYNEALQQDTDVSLRESDAYPAGPDLVYGWQKLFGEQMHQASNERIDVRIARFHNIYGPEGTYKGGKEKAPAAMCRKVVECNRIIGDPDEFANVYTGSEIEVWGDGNQTRSFLYIDDCIDAVRLLMQSDFKEPINIGSEEMISINDLAKMVIDISGKKIAIKNVPGPVGVRGRNSNNDLIRKVLNWEPKHKLREGMEKTYQWIKKQHENNI